MLLFESVSAVSNCVKKFLDHEPNNVNHQSYGSCVSRHARELENVLFPSVAIGSRQRAVDRILQ